MDFVPDVPRIVGPAGPSGGEGAGFHWDFFRSAGAGGSGYSIVPNPRVDHSQAMELKIATGNNGNGRHKQTKCSFPHRPAPVSITSSDKVDHNAAASDYLLHSPASPALVASPVKKSLASPQQRPVRVLTPAVDAAEIDGAEVRAQDQAQAVAMV